MAGAVLAPYKAAIISEFGHGPMYDDTLDAVGAREFGRRWGGVFASDRLPPLARAGRERFYVVNNATHRGPGTHWLGVYESLGGRVYVYDSFARPIVRLIPRTVKKLRHHHVVEEANLLADQRGASEVCGQLSLAFLLAVRDLGVRRVVEGRASAQ